MSKIAEKQQPKTAITVRLNPESVVLGRSLARSIYGSEEKLGVLLEAALTYYSAHQEEEGRANALLKTTEETLFRRFDDQVNQLASAIKSRDNTLVKRFTDLFAIQSYESCLSALMLEDTHYDRQKERYEKLRKTAAQRLKNRFEAAELHQGEVVLELHERLRKSNEERQKLEKEIDSLKKDIAEFGTKTAQRDEKISSLTQDLSEQKKHLLEATRHLEAYAKFLSWYKMQELFIPDYQDKNRKLMSKPSYDEALQAYKEQHPCPIKL